jgi:hypothetical protein
LDVEKSKQANLAQQHGFGQHFCMGFGGWPKTQQSLTPAVDWLDGLIG